MTKLDEILERLCLDGVEYRKVKDIVSVNRGSRLTKNQLSDDFEFEVYHGSKDTILGKYNAFNAPANTTIVVNTGGIGGVKFLPYAFWCSDGSFWLGQSSIVEPKYLYYCLSGYEDYFYSKKRVGGVPTIDKAVVEAFRIPLPPLEAQREIVRVLDEFTMLTAELTAELTARKKQYEYYKDNLFSESIKKNSDCFCSLNTISKIYDGTHSTPDYQESGIKFVSVENIKSPYDTKKYITIEAYNSYKIKPQINDILMTRIGSIGECFVINSNEALAYYVSLALIRADETKINSRYLKYYIESIFGKKELYKRTLVNAVPIKVNKDDIGKIEVYVPSLNEQQRIVDILDRFDAYCNDITQGLPAEIEARKKQYEYYRDRLLTFKEKQ